MKPDVSDVTVRKCPLHKCWIQRQRSGYKSSESVRYCPRCDQEEAFAKLKQQKETGAPAPEQLKVIKL